MATHEQLQHLYTQRGRAYELSDRYDQALANYEEMQALGQTRHDRALELEALMLRALAYAVGSGVRDFSKAQALSLDALVLADDLGDRPAEAKIYWILLLTNRFGNEGPRKAIEYGERSLALARELGLKQQVAFTLKDLGTAYVASGRIFDATACLPEALSLWRELDDKPMLAEVLMGAGASYQIAGKLDQAVRVDEESYVLNQSIRNRFGLSITACLISLAYCELGQMAMAIQRAQEAIAIGEELSVHGGLHWGSTRRTGGHVWLSGRFRACGRVGRARHRGS